MKTSLTKKKKNKSWTILVAKQNINTFITNIAYSLILEYHQCNVFKVILMISYRTYKLSSLKYTVGLLHVGKYIV